MSKKYYTLLLKYDGQWCAEFGDYKKSVVEGEKEFHEGKKKIICTNHDQKSIDSAIAELNKGK